MRTLPQAVVVCIALSLATRMEGQLEREQSRSMTISRTGIVAASQTLASAAGAKILEKGGSAADAALPRTR